MPQIDQLDIQAKIDAILNRWPSVGLAVSVVRDGAVEFSGHGVANIDLATPVTEDTVFRIGSITKTFTAVAVMQLEEQGLIDLEAPADGYLRGFRLVPAKAGWRPATVRHLLTHTGGVPEWVHPLRMINSGWVGESYPLEETLPILGEYYRGRLQLVGEPGRVWTYTDHGFAALGQIVEDVSGQPLHRYFRERIFEPLGMTDTDLLRSPRLTSRLATGYRLRSDGATAVTDREWVTAAASSIYSTPRDMARYVAALLTGGSGEHGSILKPETVALMFEPHYRPDRRISGMGLAFWRVDLGGHNAVEHQGVLPGFNSEIFLAPYDGVGVIAFTNGSRNAASWLTGETERLVRELIGASEQGIRTDVPQHPEIWGELCGWYRPHVQRTDLQARGLLGAGAQVGVRRGQLILRTLSPIPALYRGLQLHPDDKKDPYVFRMDLSKYGLGTIRVVFSRDPSGTTTGVHLDGILLSAYKHSRSTNPRTLAASAVGVVAAATTVKALRRSRRRRHARRRP
jgi:CubicO group peptidase (beta-lactamase class C family)